MKNIFNRLGFKLAFVYLVFSFINMTVFSFILYQSQIRFVIKVVKSEVDEYTEDLLYYIDQASEISDKNVLTNDLAVEKIKKYIKEYDKSSKIEEYSIFTEKGKMLYSSNGEKTVSQNHLANTIKAVTAAALSSKRYYSILDSDQYSVKFYVPHIYDYNSSATILYLKMNIENFDDIVSDLYTRIAVAILIIALVHLILALFIARLILIPLNELSSVAKEISNGEYSKRANTNSKDEIGYLANSFNTMAESIESKITKLDAFQTNTKNELLIASHVQDNIYPSMNSFPDLNISVYIKPFSEVSGDYYDVIRINDDITVFLIVDAVGHGIPAALITMVAKELFSSSAKRDLSPADVMKLANQRVFKIFSEKNISGFYFTALYIKYDKNENKITCSNGGHLAPLYLNCRDRVIEKLEIEGAILGLFNDDLFESSDFKVMPGDKLILYTDGIVEERCSDYDFYGTERFLKIIENNMMKTPAEIKEAVISDLNDYSGSDNYGDDVTLMVVEF